jgi:hypothetical protein
MSKITRDTTIYRRDQNRAVEIATRMYFLLKYRKYFENLLSGQNHRNGAAIYCSFDSFIFGQLITKSNCICFI